MKQKLRHKAILQLIEEIKQGSANLAGITSARVLLIDELELSKPGHCAVCGVLLLGRQDMFCSGHWDYLVCDIPRTRPFTGYVEAVAKWLAIAESGLRIERKFGHVMGVVTGNSRCEVCGSLTVNTEFL